MSKFTLKDFLWLSQNRTMIDEAFKTSDVFTVTVDGSVLTVTDLTPSGVAELVGGGILFDARVETSDTVHAFVGDWDEVETHTLLLELEQKNGSETIYGD